MSSLELNIKGMTCIQCEKIILRKLSKCEGIKESKISYKNNTAEILFDHSKINEDEIIEIIVNAGYEVKKSSEVTNKSSHSIINGMLIVLIALYLIFSNTIGINFLPQVQSTMGYGMLFIVGLLTSVHCVAMCGGINLSQCIKPISIDGTVSVPRSSLLYNSGRVVSYTVIGAVVGALGSVISFTGIYKGIISMFAGIFMILMGINMIGTFRHIKKVNIQIPAGLRDILLGKNGQRGPFTVGLINGLMPCGPLQTMQLYALGTGNPIDGALSMFAFSLGTVPLMFSFGAMSTLLSKGATKRLMKASAVLVIVLGLVMFQRGTALSGISLNAYSVLGLSQDDLSSAAEIIDGVQIINLEVETFDYPAINVKKDIPVKINFHVTAEKINGCNETIIFPEYGIEKHLDIGDNWVEFTPQENGVFPYSCWMGMINSSITVVD